MNLLITFDDYKKNGGIAMPGEINDYDKSNGINSESEKFNKWLEYTQIQLNYVLQDKLEGAEYNLLNFKEAYRRDIINILVIRLNRAFENERLIPRNENVQYAESGGINWNSSSEIHGEGWSFWNEQELHIIETSGLFSSVNNFYVEGHLERQYPITLTEDMANRIITDDSIEINKKVNPSNGLTALEFKASEKIARKSEIPDIKDLATKKELEEKQNQLEDNIEHRIGKGVSHTDEYNEVLEEHFAEKLDIKSFFNKIVETLKQGKNVTFDIDEEKKIITINATGDGFFTCDSLENCKDKINEIISDKFYTKTDVDSKLGTKQNSGYLNYTYDGGQQDRPFFQTYDIEHEVKGFDNLLQWLNSFKSLERTGLIGTINIIGPYNSTGSGYFIYTKLPNNNSQITFTVQRNSTVELILSERPTLGVIRIDGGSNAQETYYSYVKRDYSTGVCGGSNCDVVSKWRIQIITIFGNNNGKLVFPNLESIAKYRKANKNGK